MSSNMLHRKIDADKLDTLVSCKTSEECAIWLDMHCLATAEGICSILTSIEQTWHILGKDKIIADEDWQYRSDACVKNIFKAICDAHVLDEKECKKLLTLANAKVKMHKNTLKRLSKKLLHAKQLNAYAYIKSNALETWYEIWCELLDKVANILTKQQFDSN